MAKIWFKFILTPQLFPESIHYADHIWKIYKVKWLWNSEIFLKTGFMLVSNAGKLSIPVEDLNKWFM